ncbi:low specificity L-threonine aldolase [Trichomonascus vanleenenianus]|uniref:threonine aldolase GLY1 n=1 Tax=Trichomonascus vanleenenianus TaxID=2268995 RepID=UPI003EC99DDD
MIKAMTEATLGDSVYGEDETTLEFERRITELTGKEAALYVVSGTLSNQIGIRTHLHQPPHSVLCDYRAHIYSAEAAGLAILSQAMVTPVRPKNGTYLTLEDIKSHVILGEDIHTAPTKIVSLENTLGGVIMPIEEIRRISEWAWANGLKMHLDGARLWNASAETGIPLAEYGKYFDSMSLCMSKGLGAPVGSVLVGTRDFIKRAAWFRKQQGGGIRQAGPLTAAAIVAIDEVWPTMKQTHAKTKALAERWTKAGIEFMAPVNTNFIFLDLDKSGIDLGVLERICKEHKVNVWPPRIVLHHLVSDQAIERLATAVELAKASTEKTDRVQVKTGYNQM